MPLRDQVAIVTGGSRGLGRHIALALAREGAHVVLAYARHDDLAHQVRQEIEALGRRALAIRADVAAEADVQAMVERSLGEFRRIDMLVNNAGVSIDGVSWKLSQDDWQRVIDVNLTGAFLCMKHVLPAMRERQYGRIVNIASVVGQTGVAGTAAYAASKSALFGLTKTIAREVARRGITVNALALGYINEGMLHTLPPEQRDRLLEAIPMGRFGEASDVTSAVRFLCGPEAGYITGAILSINGGYYM
jgi:3-oxoacyl-[acyl-carrier protein] reductase